MDADPHSDPLIKSTDPDPDPSIIKKNSKKIIDFYCSVTFYQSSGSLIRVRMICMLLGLPDPHPDPLDRGTDPRIRIKISQIHNTAFQLFGEKIFLKDVLKQEQNVEWNQ